MPSPGRSDDVASGSAEAFCAFLLEYDGPVFTDPSIPPAFTAVIAGGDPADALEIARTRLKPAIQDLRAQLETMSDEPAAADFVAHADEVIDPFEQAVDAYIAAPSSAAARAVDETGTTFDTVLLARDFTEEKLKSEVFHTSCA